MRILLDTCTFLWVVDGAPELSVAAAELFSEPSNDVFLSSVSTWEISVKHALGRLSLPREPADFVPAMREAHGIEALSLDEESTLFLPRLPAYHRDPFDRMLVCQALVQNMVILTPDAQVRQYPVKSNW